MNLNITLKDPKWCNCNTGYVSSYNPTLFFRIRRFFLGGQSDYATHLGCGKYIRPKCIEGEW